MDHLNRGSVASPLRNLPGLLTHEGRQQLDGGDWAAVEQALGDVLAAVTQLDDGVHYQLYLTASIVLRIDEPRAICTISATSSNLRAGTTATTTPG